MSEGEIINKVAESGLITINLEEYLPEEEILEFDIKDFLFQELLLREKDFRESMKDLDWSRYKDKYVAAFCSSDAIIPDWAYMLIASHLQPVAKLFIFGTKVELENLLIHKELSQLDLDKFKDEKIIIKGCGDVNVPTSAYMEITRLLRPIARSIMYGEPCSTVPIYKNKK